MAAKITRLADDIERPHPPGADQEWQQSIVLGWADPSREIGGFARIGHQPHLGLTRSCFGVVSRNGLNYTRTAQGLDMQPGDRTEDSFIADGFQSATFGIQSSRWCANDAHVDLDLRVRDVHPPYDFWDLAGFRNETSRVMAANHLQAGGVFDGSIRIGDEARQEIAGFTYRDHSWGPRHVDDPNGDMYSAWWIAGALSASFSFGFGGSRMRSGLEFEWGYIARDGIVDAATIEDASVHMAFDGLSNRGGEIVARSEQFGLLHFEALGYGNVWLEMGRKHFEMATPCTIRCGGLVGGGLINTIMNPRNGTARPDHLASGALDNGLYRSRNGLNIR